MTDLKLIPIEELVGEIFDRTETCIIGYTKKEDLGAPLIYVYHICKSGKLTGIGLCEMVKYRLLMNLNNEGFSKENIENE